MKFEIKDRDAAGRICNFSTKHGKVTSPNLMPVINPNKLTITPKDMKKLFGTEIIITNSYIIKKNEKLKKIAIKKGVHSLINFDGPIMTDSGTFQTYIYGEIDLDPVEIIKFQINIGSDIGTILDVFGKPNQTKKEAEKSINETLKRAKKGVELKGKMNLACTVQGSIYPNLREKCARELSKIDADFFPIGGVVPIMESQRYSDLVRIIISSKKGLDPSKPVHLFGAGHPLIFPLAVALGCDFFDSSAYVKYANDNRLIFPWGTEKLQDISELPCSCPVCSNYKADELKKLDEKDRLIEIAKHNLYVSYTELKKIRNAISQGCLWELVERRANSNPYLFHALKLLRLKENKIWLEQFDPTSKNKALFYTGEHSIHRPIIYRVHNRLLKRYKSSKNLIVFPEGEKPYSIHYSREAKEIQKKSNFSIIFDSHIGPVPIELDEMYPFAQSVFPEFTDNETENVVSKVFNDFTKNKNIICWKGFKTIKELKDSIDIKVDADLLRISAVCEMQFGVGSSSALLNGDIKIIKSEKTGKIRNVYCNRKHILSMRASDGLFTLKLDGGKILHRKMKKPMLRVVVDKDSASFVKKGKSVFAKFVKECDPGLRPLDECIIVNEKDDFLAVGRCILNRLEMLSFDHGMAVKIREYVK